MVKLSFNELKNYFEGIKEDFRIDVLNASIKVSSFFVSPSTDEDLGKIFILDYLNKRLYLIECRDTYMINKFLQIEDFKIYKEPNFLERINNIIYLHRKEFPCFKARILENASVFDLYPRHWFEELAKNSGRLVGYNMTLKFLNSNKELADYITHYIKRCEDEGQDPRIWGNLTLSLEIVSRFDLRLNGRAIYKVFPKLLPLRFFMANGMPICRRCQNIESNAIDPKQIHPNISILPECKKCSEDGVI